MLWVYCVKYPNTDALGWQPDLPTNNKPQYLTTKQKDSTYYKLLLYTFNYYKNVTVLKLFQRCIIFADMSAIHRNVIPICSSSGHTREVHECKNV